ncbi:hypothetical protein BV372_08050 [Nostoc sp. T09]|uniref:hypothetical protein n=1 Tax=Nostoc sp. T09 TaxID=1932621 RepID=UPI000A3A3B4F|nr:hypothetical protein [Nostoc sp. T09]OUL36361.1 hypothetical protein BV372_08050 [Nostoc sp. T09]
MSDLQFATLDYASAELYTSLTQQPSTATPLNLPLEDFSKKPPSTNLDPLNEAFRIQDQQRQQSLFQQQREAQQLREQALREREIARNQQLLNKRSPIDEPGPVQSRDYEAQYEKPVPIEEFHPKPSTAEPPTTPQTSGARPTPETAPGVLPKTGSPTKPVSASVDLPGVLPRSVPTAIGRAAIPAAFAAVDFGVRVVNGQSVNQAAFGTAGGVIGGIAGAAIGGALGGPVGSVVGGLIGGAIGGNIADYIWKQVGPHTGTPPVDAPTGPYPFFGGQSPNVSYKVSCDWDFYFNGNFQSTQHFETSFVNGVVVTVGAGNPIPGRSSVGAYVLFRRPNGDIDQSDAGLGFYPGCECKNVRNISITRQDGLPDDGGNPAPYPIPGDYRLPGSVGHPGNSESYPPGGNPNSNSPGSKPPAGVSSGGPATGNNRPPSDSATGTGSPAPRKNPHPDYSPGGLGGNLPGTAPAPTPNPQGNPSAIGGSSTGTGSSQGIPSANPGPGVDTVTLTSPVGGVSLGPSGPAQPVPLGSTKSGFKPYPTENSVTKPPGAENPNPTKTDKRIEDLEKEIIRQGSALAIITGLLQQLNNKPASNPLSRDATKSAVQEAVCEIAQPDKCLGAPIKNAEDAAKSNGDKLDDLATQLAGLNTAGNAVQIGLLNTINAKIGEQLPGGLAGKLTRFSQWLQLDRALNLMILATTIHNGLMLSNDIGQTLLGAINNILQVIGLKGDDGQAFNLGSVVSGGIENLIKSIVGEENYTVLNAAYQKANRIYQATTNVLNQLMNVNSIITNALEVIGSYTGKIGNALRIWGVVGEKAYSWMNPQPSFDNKWIGKLQQLQEGANTVAMVAQIPVDAVNAVTELNNSTTGLISAIKQDPDTKNGVDVGEAAKVKQEREEAKSVSFVPNFDISDLFDADD